MAQGSNRPKALAQLIDARCGLVVGAAIGYTQGEKLPNMGIP
ncbi:MAG: hypothetical protein FD119_3542 [Stygiobacter sp.]|nr:MAG: hypothetical protein FD119_3542 [Stygiobacter sp.]